jgi:hypothetical protein
MPKAGPDSWDDDDDSLGVEDPAIEIARLLRPVTAKTEARPVGRRSEPAAPTSERRKAGESEPLELGTAETPEIVERPARLPDRSGSADGPAERPVAGQAPLPSGGMPPAADARVPERAAPTATGVQGKEPASGMQSAETHPASGDSTSPLGLESPCEALPKCLTEPWDDAESGRWQLGQDKSPRRWPFRRSRSTGEVTGRPEDPRSAADSRRTRSEKGSDPKK